MVSACAIVACERPARSRGMCSPHYQRWARNPDGFNKAPVGEANAVQPNPWAGRVPCPDCGSTAWTLPYDPDDAQHGWRCVECHISFHPPTSEGAGSDPDALVTRR